MPRSPEVQQSTASSSLDGVWTKLLGLRVLMPLQTGLWIAAAAQISNCNCNKLYWTPDFLDWDFPPCPERSGWYNQTCIGLLTNSSTEASSVHSRMHRIGGRKIIHDTMKLHKQQLWRENQERAWALEVTAAPSLCPEGTKLYYTFLTTSVLSRVFWDPQWKSTFAPAALVQHL